MINPCSNTQDQDEKPHYWDRYYRYQQLWKKNMYPAIVALSILSGRRTT
jgi:hypothetical protein